MERSKVEADIQKTVLMLAVEVALCRIPLEVRDQMGVRKRLVASVVAGERPAESITVVLGKGHVAHFDQCGHSKLVSDLECVWHVLQSSSSLTW